VASATTLAGAGEVGYPVPVGQSDKKRVFPGGGRRSGCFGCGGSGCGSFLLVLLLGGALSLFNLAFGIGVSIQIPFTPSNFTAAGTIGTKEKAVETLPGYVEGRLAGNQNFINHSTTLTIGPAEGIGLLVIGAQPDAPPIDLHLALR
jgi:hypothetical protein